MSRTRMAAYAAALLLALATACGTPATGHRAPAVQPPAPTCAAGITPITAPEPDLSGDRDGDGINDTRPVPTTC